MYNSNCFTGLLGLLGGAVHEIMNMCFMNREEQYIVVRKYNYESDDQGCYEKGAKEVLNCKGFYKIQILNYEN